MIPCASLLTDYQCAHSAPPRPPQVDVLFEFISLLIKDDPAASADADTDDEDWDEEQNLVARLVHHLACPETDGQYRMLVAVRRHFGQGGPRRLPHTLPPLVFSGLQLVRQLQAQSDVEGYDVAVKKLFQFLYQTTQALAEVPRAESALRLYLQCAQAASSCGLETVAYEFCERAFELFEESIPGALIGLCYSPPDPKIFRALFSLSSLPVGLCAEQRSFGRFVPFVPILADTKAQIVALQLIIGSLHRCTVFSGENRETLVHKATSYSSKLLKARRTPISRRRRRLCFAPPSLEPLCVACAACQSRSESRATLLF